MRTQVWQGVARLALCGMLVSCRSDGKVAGPDAVEPDMRVAQAVFTQVAQDTAGSLPMVAGVPAVAKVFAVRSASTVEEVPVVLRLFREGRVVYSDTTRTGGVLGPTRSLEIATAEFLVPGAFVASDVSWQVELDPAGRVADLSRSNNLLPAQGSTPLQVVALPPIRMRLMPVILTAHGDVAGNVTASNVDAYVQRARQLFPATEFTVRLGAPVRSPSFFGPPPRGGDVGFWSNVLEDLDKARLAAGATEEYWYGVVMIPPGYDSYVFGGYGWIPSSGSLTGARSRAAVGMSIGPGINASVASSLLAHELGHNFGRLHGPGCGSVPPFDPDYPGSTGGLFGVGHDVWSWANAGARGAAWVGPSTAGELMTYCQPFWIGPYTHRAVLQWRAQSSVVLRGSTTETGRAMP